jgi:hypothetical protein
MAAPDYQRQLQSVRRTIAALPDISELLEQFRDLGEWARTELRNAMPDNWSEFDVGALDGLIDLTARQGVAVVLVPRGDIVAE